MPFFRVMLHGTGISYNFDETVSAAIGFYTTRIVRAASQDQAGQLATAIVERLWESGNYAEKNRGSPPKLTVDGITKVSLLEYIRNRKGGHSFYAVDDDGGVQA